MRNQIACGIPVAGVLWILLAVPVLAQEPETVVTGTVTILQRIAIPPNSRLGVSLMDVSKMDTAATQIASQSIVTKNQPPYAFKLVYDPAKIVPNHRYNVQATLSFENDNAARFLTTKAYPVLTNGAGKSVEIILTMVSPTAPKPAPGTAKSVFSGTYQHGANQGSFDAIFRGNRLERITETVQRGTSAKTYATYGYFSSGTLRRYLESRTAIATSVNPKTQRIKVDVSATFNSRGKLTDGYKVTNGKRSFIPTTDKKAILDQAAELRAEALRLQGG